MDNFNIQKFFKDQYLTEAEAIPTEPGIPGERASNHDRKMAMRSVVDILKDELGVDQDDAFDYIRTHRDDLFDGTVDAFSKDEVVDDYKEYMSVNMDSLNENEDEIASRIRKLGKENGIANADIEKYVGELSGFFEPDAYKNTTDAELLDDLKLYMDLAEGVIKENDKNDYANSEEDFTDSMVVEKIKDIIKYHELDPQDVMEEIGQEFGIAFEFGRG